MKQYDAIIVGLGAAGGIIAQQLTEAGMQVLALDKGPDYLDEDFVLKHDELRYYVRGSIVAKPKDNPLTWRPTGSDRAVALPWSAGPLGVDEPFYGLPSIGTGGGSVHWGAASYRFRPADFIMRSTIIGRFGDEAIPADSTLVDWPISYEDLEPYYDRAEWEQGVSGHAAQTDVLSVTGVNPFDPPRRRGYPMPPLRPGPADRLFVDACERLGYHPFPQPVAINSVDYNGRPACNNCGFCHGFPCHIGAKSSTQATSVPLARATGNLDVRGLSRVYEVLVGPTGRARGVAYVDPQGERREASADLVILAAYALENARLLLLSDINPHGQVGRNFMTHNFGWYTGILPVDVNPFIGSMNASSAIDDVTSELIPDNEFGALWGSPIISVTGDLQPIEATDMMPPEGPRWGADLKEWLRHKYRRIFRMYSQTTNLPSPRHFCDLDPNHRDDLGMPALRITHSWDELDVNTVRYLAAVKRTIGKAMDILEFWEHDPNPFYHLSTHDVGIHRMGEDPSASVTDSFGAVHGHKGLYAVGGGQFPTYGSYNPTLTIQAMAYRTGDHLIGR